MNRFWLGVSVSLLCVSVLHAEPVTILPVEIESEEISLYVEARRQSEYAKTTMQLCALSLGVLVFIGTWPRPSEML